MLQRKDLEQSEFQEAKTHIHECHHITELLKYILETYTEAAKKAVFVDLDNTLQQPEVQEKNMGSDQFFMKLMSMAFEITPSKDTETLVLTIYHAIQQCISTQAVEKETVDVIKHLQEKNIPVIGLTARFKDIIEPTVKQLKNIGIEFNFKNNSEDHFGLTIEEEENVAYFSHGIIFCSAKSKGDCLKEFFKKTQWYPDHVVMIDDKDKHLYAIEKAVHSYGGKFDGLRYGYLDQEVAKFNHDEHAMEIANMKLLDIYHKFPEPAKEAVKKLFYFGPPHPEAHSIFKRIKTEQASNEEKQIKHGKWF